MRQGVRFLAAVVALSAAGFGCAAGGPQQGAGAPVAATAGADGVQRLTIVAKSFAFTPNRVTVKVGAPVELTLSKEPDMIPHSFVLRAPEAGVAVSEQLDTRPRVVRFTATRPGSYEFFCDHSFGRSHRSLGMVGTLEVVP